MRKTLMALAIGGSAFVGAVPVPGGAWTDFGGSLRPAHAAETARPVTPAQLLAQGAAKTAVPAPGTPKSTIDPRTQEADCAWVGKRTIRVLVRDDLIAAEGFMRLYTAFGCPVPHLSGAFACTFGGSKEMLEFGFENRVEACWSDPRTHR